MSLRVLILGAGPAQRDAIRHLKDRGCWVAACGNRRVEGLDGILDRFAPTDIADVDALHRHAADWAVDRVYSVGSDLAMTAVAAVSERLDLPRFVGGDTALRFADKVRMRKVLKALSLSPVRHRAVETPADLDGWSIFPAVVKPSVSQGQRGISLVRDAADLETALAASLAASRAPVALIEEYLDGPEFSVNLLLRDGAVAAEFMLRREIVEGDPGGIPCRHVMPADLGPDAVNATQSLVRRSAEAFGVRDGPLYFQIKLTASGPRIIECSARLDGCHNWRLIRQVTGFDLLAATCDLLCGEEIPEPTGGSADRKWSLAFFLQPPHTRFDRRDHCPPPDAMYTEYYLPDGAPVPRINGRLEKVGYSLFEVPG